MSFIIAKLLVHTNVRFGLVFQRNMTLSRCHPRHAHHAHFSWWENVVCRAQRVQLHSGWQPRAKVHKKLVRMQSRESAQTTKTTNRSMFNTMTPWRRARTTESQNASKNITDGHALCNVRGNDDSLANGSGSSLSFCFFWSELFQIAARKSHDVLTERRHVCNELVDHA